MHILVAVASAVCVIHFIDLAHHGFYGFIDIVYCSTYYKHIITPWGYLLFACFTAKPIISLAFKWLAI